MTLALGTRPFLVCVRSVASASSRNLPWGRAQPLVLLAIRHFRRDRGQDGLAGPRRGPTSPRAVRHHAGYEHRPGQWPTQFGSFAMQSLQQVLGLSVKQVTVPGGAQQVPINGPLVRHVEGAQQGKSTEHVPRDPVRHWQQMPPSQPHPSPSRQLWPQLPQLSGFPSVTVQVPLQQWRPMPHGILSTAGMQVLLGPQVRHCSALQLPHPSVLPQPSGIDPQVLPWAAQVVGVQPHKPGVPPPPQVSGGVQLPASQAHEPSGWQSCPGSPQSSPT
jgi:hypothetical protein